ncbi:MAG: hypothetical protein AB1657_02925 [Candidatus Micrarchaeota archaeon]
MQSRLVVYIAALAVLVVLIAGGMKFYETRVLSEDARAYVLEDLRANNPDADVVEIFFWETRANPDGGSYYAIKARVSEGLDTPCPKRTHYTYYYPEQNFVPEPPERITIGCSVCEGNGCVIAFPEEAIIASHTNSGAAAVHAYITRYADAMPAVVEQEDGWAVSWRSAAAGYGYDVEIAKDGEIESIARA